MEKPISHLFAFLFQTHKQVSLREKSVVILMTGLLLVIVPIFLFIIT